MTGLVVTGNFPPFDNLDFKRAALLGWIRWTLAALSRAEKAAVKSLAVLLALTFLTNDFRAISRFLLRVVLTLSFLTFLIAERMIGMGGIVT